MTGILESIAYALSRGFFRAWLEHQADISAADLESPDENARANARRFAAAIRLRQSRSDSGPKSSAQGSQGNNSDHMGTAR